MTETLDVNTPKTTRNATENWIQTVVSDEMKVVTGGEIALRGSVFGGHVREALDPGEKYEPALFSTLRFEGDSDVTLPSIMLGETMGVENTPTVELTVLCVYRDRVKEQWGMLLLSCLVESSKYQRVGFL